jgi:2-polyprenyl-3-methyl-5-hydroxy-6-metoxy-1,4-benzoquinol methylase
MSGVVEVTKYSPEFESAIAAYSSEPRDNPGPKANLELYQRVTYAKMFLEFCARYFDIKGMRFIEVGCGTGTVSAAAALLGASFVAATDYVEHSVELTRQRWQDHNIDGDLFQSDIRDPVRADRVENFDIVFCQQVIEHIPRKDQFTSLANLFKMVKSGGYLFIDTENSMCPYDRHDTTTWLLRYLSKSTYDPILRKLGKNINYYEHSAAERVDSHDYISYDELIGASAISGFEVVSPFMPHGDKKQALRVLTGSDWLHDSVLKDFDVERYYPISILLRKKQNHST